MWADCKKYDGEKKQQGGCAEGEIKTVQAPLRQAQRPKGMLRQRIRGGDLFSPGDRCHSRNCP